MLDRGKALEWNLEGQPARMIGTHTDISDRKQAEADRLQAEQFRQELKLLENILDVILAGYWDWHMSSNYEYLSPGFKRMFGYEDSELPNVPETWMNLIFSEDLPGVLACFDRHVASRGEIPFHNEVRYRHKDGSTVWVICSGKVIEWDAEAKPLRAIGCHIDITERKKAEAELVALTSLNQAILASASYSIISTTEDGTNPSC
jgi:PAS domain S-box-containing protein